jgi:hypothetical protein
LTFAIVCAIIKTQGEDRPKGHNQKEDNMKKYYYDCPRGFSNEFAIISVDQKNAHEIKAFNEYLDRYNNSQNANWDLHQITAKRVKEIVATERAQKRAYERAGMNLVNNPVGATSITIATEYFREEC